MLRNISAILNRSGGKTDGLSSRLSYSTNTLVTNWILMSERNSRLRLSPLSSYCSCEAGSLVRFSIPSSQVLGKSVCTLTQNWSGTTNRWRCVRCALQGSACQRSGRHRQERRAGFERQTGRTVWRSAARVTLLQRAKQEKKQQLRQVHQRYQRVFLGE